MGKDNISMSVIRRLPRYYRYLNELSKFDMDFKSGKIDEMLGRAATVFENELDERIAAISTMIEPILMVIMAAVIGVVIAGTLLPIYSLVNSI